LKLRKSIAIVTLTVIGSLFTAPANAVPNEPVTWSLLAAGERSEVLTTTAEDTTHSHNGSAWYFNTESMGFVKDGFCIDQDSADGADSWFYCDQVLGFNQESAQTRLSWHTYSDGIDGGWRVGTVTQLNNSEETIRAVYTANAQPAYYPSGPRPLVDSADLTGWELCYIGTYDDQVLFSDLWAACDGNYLLFAGYAADYEWVGEVPVDAPAQEESLADTGVNPASIAVTAFGLLAAGSVALRRRTRR
jgi:hypothetical protein